MNQSSILLVSKISDVVSLEAGMDNTYLGTPGYYVHKHNKDSAE